MAWLLGNLADISMLKRLIRARLSQTQQKIEITRSAINCYSTEIFRFHSMVGTWFIKAFGHHYYLRTRQRRRCGRTADGLEQLTCVQSKCSRDYKNKFWIGVSQIIYKFYWTNSCLFSISCTTGSTPIWIISKNIVSKLYFRNSIDSTYRSRLLETFQDIEQGH